MVAGGVRVATVTPTYPDPDRARRVREAMRSIVAQTVLPSQMLLEWDLHGDGAAVTRNRVLASIDPATCDWVAFLDDDDTWLPQHLQLLLEHADQTNADVVYSGCLVLGPDRREIPRREEWGRFGHQFDSALLRLKSYLPVTCLVRARYALQARFHAPIGTDYDDWGYYLDLMNRGAVFSHLPVVTWIWNHHGRNTSGRADRR